MKYLKSTTLFLFLFSIFNLIFPTKTYAYLDPGTGSFFIQTLLAFLLGGLLTIKVFWKNIKAFFSNLFSKKQKTENENNER